MGQQFSALSEAKQRVIDIKRQAAATDLIGSGVWYYNPSTGKNIWGNRAALQLYGLAAEAFCAPQRAAWLAEGGEAALGAWQLSNEQLLQSLACKAVKAPSCRPGQLSSNDVTVHITSSTASTSPAAGASSAGSCAAHAAFLPLPAGVLQVSARLSACSVLHRGKLLRAYLVQVVGVQHSSCRACSSSSSSNGTMRKSLKALTVDRSGSQLAALQLALTQQLNLQPEVLLAAQLPQQQQQQSSSNGVAEQQKQQQQFAVAAAGSCSSGNDTVHVPAQQPLDSPAAAASAGQSRLSIQCSSSLGSCPAAAAAGTAAPAAAAAPLSAAQAVRNSDGGCGPEMLAAAQRLRQSFERQVSQQAGRAQADRPGSFELPWPAAAAVPGVRRAHSTLEKRRSNSLERQQQQQQQQQGGLLAPGIVSALAALPSGNSCSTSSGYRRQGSGGLGNPTYGSLSPLYLRSNSNSMSLQLPLAGEELAARQLRLTEMCDNHAMFQFLFDPQGRLLAANKRAMNNMREHLGEHSSYTLPQYLAIGQCDGGLSAEQMFAVISNAMFVNGAPCFRLPQLRYSKRRPGKCRWVLYEMWCMVDPVTGQPALLVTEQNITQVKSVEEQYSSHMRQLEVQLEEALLQQQQAEAAVAAAEAVAAEAAAVAAAAAAAAAGDGSSRRAHYLPAIDTSSAAEKTLQLLDKLLLGAPVVLEDVEALRDALLSSSSNMHAPLFLDEQVLHHTRALAYDSEVGASLLQMLSGRAWVSGGGSGGSSGKDGASALPYGEEADTASLTAETNVVASHSGSIFTAAGSSSGSIGLASPPGVLPAGLAAARVVADARSSGMATSRCSIAAVTAATAPAEPGTEQSALSGSCATNHHQQQQQQQRPQLVSAYPKVTADTLPAAAATVAGCSVCTGMPAAGAGGSSAAAAGAAAGGLGVCVSGGSATRGSVTAAAREVMGLTAAPSLELEAMLARVDDWQFDSFKLAAVTGNRPLSVLGFFLFKRSRLVKRCGLDEGRLARWLVRMEEGYPPNPYHNRVHAADVTRNLHVLLTRGGLGAAAAADDIATLAAYMAGVVHDFEHRGVNNDFLVRSCDALALLYNDRSPHENHHLAASWGLLVEHDFLHGMPRTKRELLRRLVIEMVLATDMKQHFAIHGLFQSKLHLLAALSMQRSSSATASTAPAATTPRGSSSLPTLVTVTSGSAAAAAAATAAVAGGSSSSVAESPSVGAFPSRHHMQLGSAASGALSSTARTGSATCSSTAAAAAAAAAGEGPAAASVMAAGPGPPPAASIAAGGSFVLSRLRSGSSLLKRGGAPGAVAGVGSGDGGCGDSPEDDAETRSLYLQMALKASDLGHLAAPREVHKQWVAALEEENFRQGDRERAVGLPVSPLMDRSKQGISRSQVGFFDIVALPLFTSLAQHFAGCCPMLEAVLDNYTMWKEQEQQQQHS